MITANQPLILEIKGNSLDDGPGIRTVVFFKGCPLNCLWCHNPESKKAVPEIAFDPGKCVNCNTCLATCTRDALSRVNKLFIDRTKCDLCFKCAAGCPSGALARVGRRMTIADIAAKVLEDKAFFDASKGGVTFSGGEPTLYMEFLGKTAQSLREKGIHVLLETCGHFDCEKFNELVYPHLDLIYFDIKIMDSSQHSKYCGLPNATILKNFKKLHTKFLQGGTEVLPRTPLIPGITDTKENLSAIVSFYRDEKVKKTQLMPYNPLWLDKYPKIGLDPSVTNQNRLDKWMSHQQIKRCEELFTEAGILAL